MRIKSQWFNAEKQKTPAEMAGAMAFISWRISQNTLKQMRTADFDIDIGQHYFTFTREVLGFLCHVLDRMAYAEMDAESRVAFTTALVRRVAEILHENEEIYLGTRDPAQATYAEEFIALFNELGEHYAEFNCVGGEPEFAFVRCFGYRIETLMPEKDRHWVVDQLMNIEVPDAVELLHKGMSGVTSKEPRKPRRTGVSTGE
jgi:hypothetical protein